MSKVSRGSKSRWYWAELVVAMHRAAGGSSAKSIGHVWFDLIIVKATSPQNAIEKANRAGQSRSESLFELNGKEVRSEFLGIKAIGLLHEGLVDGAEITFTESRMSLSRARRYVIGRDSLLKSLNQELDPIVFVESMTKADRQRAAKSVREATARVRARARGK